MIPIDAAGRSLMRRLRDILRAARDASLVALDAVVLFALHVGKAGPRNDRIAVAIFNLHGAGDLLLSLPCLRRLREAFPADRYALTLICGPSITELAALYAPVDHLLAVDRHRLQRSVSYRISILKTIVKGGYAIAVQPSFNRTLAVEDSLMRATGAEMTFGSAGSPIFSSGLARWFGNRWYRQLMQPSAAAMHELDRYSEFLEGLGWQPADSSALVLTAPPGPPPAGLVDFILVIPDASSPLKSWPMSNFEELAHRLAARTAAPIVFAGAIGAKQPRHEFVRWREGRFTDLTGRTPTAEFLRLIAGARLIVTNDSGGLHLALALDRPVVAVAGGGLPQRYHPYPAGGRPTPMRIVENRLPCYGCNWKCIYRVAPGDPAYCVGSVSVEQVLDAVLALERDGQPAVKCDGSSRTAML
jgi:ADP-heptose:LPS heptosyltransferase